MIKNKLLKSAMNLVKNNFPNYDKEKIEEIQYGLETLYLGITKLIIIFLTAWIAGYLKEVFLCSIIFGAIRMTAFGAHADNSLTCLIVSFIIMFGLPLISEVLVLSIYIKVLVCLICIILYFLYAPADTSKRPLVSKSIRKRLKVFSILLASTYSVIALFTTNIFISNLLILCMLIEGINITPFFYRILSMEFNNYKKYEHVENI